MESLIPIVGALILVCFCLRKGQKLCARCKIIRNAEVLLGNLLASPKGKQRLASAIANPIRRQLDYESVFRAACTVEPLPANMQQAPQGRVLVPELEIQPTPSIKFSELRERQFNVKKKKKKMKRRKFKTIAKS